MNTPIYNALMNYANENLSLFHMPGHKMGTGIPKDITENILSLDVTEVSGTDNLHYPEQAIRQAQKLASKVFGADQTFFLVNGSTCGIHAMIMTVCNRGDKIIVSRDCHKSVIGGMMLAGAEPVFIESSFNSEFSVPTTISPLEIKKTIRKHPKARAVFITRPNYYGICSDIEEIANIVHDFNKPLLVDEAHGAHLCFNNSLPMSAVKAGADMCVQSAHKTLPAVTQGAYLHIKGDRVDIKSLKQNLRLIMTSSPSYIIMAYLDIAREIMETEGKKKFDNIFEYINDFKQTVENSDCYKVLEQRHVPHGYKDKTRLVINVKNIGRMGFEVEKILRQFYKIQVEMSDLYNIVCIATVADKKEDFNKLASALLDIEQKFKQDKSLTDINIIGLHKPKINMGPSEVKDKRQVKTNLKESIGKICADMVVPYPPGVPLLCPGEIIKDETVRYIYSIIDMGGTVNGIDEEGRIMVVDEKGDIYNS